MVLESIFIPQFHLVSTVTTTGCQEDMRIRQRMRVRTRSMPELMNNGLFRSRGGHTGFAQVAHLELFELVA